MIRTCREVEVTGGACCLDVTGRANKELNGAKEPGTAASGAALKSRLESRTRFTMTTDLIGSSERLRQSAQAGVDWLIELASTSTAVIISALSISMPSIAIASCDDADLCFIFIRQQDATCMFGQSAVASTLLQPLARSASKMMPMNEVMRRIVT